VKLLNTGNNDGFISNILDLTTKVEAYRRC
jgi:hypothetical protein